MKTKTGGACKIYEVFGRWHGNCVWECVSQCVFLLACFIYNIITRKPLQSCSISSDSCHGDNKAGPCGNVDSFIVALFTLVLSWRLHFTGSQPVRSSCSFPTKNFSTLLICTSMYALWENVKRLSGNESFKCILSAVGCLTPGAHGKVNGMNGALVVCRCKKVHWSGEFSKSFLKLLVCLKVHSIKLKVF